MTEDILDAPVRAALAYARKHRLPEDHKWIAHLASLDVLDRSLTSEGEIPLGVNARAAQKARQIIADESPVFEVRRDGVAMALPREQLTDTEIDDLVLERMGGTAEQTHQAQELMRFKAARRNQQAQRPHKVVWA